MVRAINITILFTKRLSASVFTGFGVGHRLYFQNVTIANAAEFVDLIKLTQIQLQITLHIQECVGAAKNGNT